MGVGKKRISHDDAFPTARKVESPWKTRKKSAGSTAAFDGSTHVPRAL